jgi:hypothetical protein
MINYVPFYAMTYPKISPRSFQADNQMAYSNSPIEAVNATRVYRGYFCKEHGCTGCYGTPCNKFNHQ